MTVSTDGQLCYGVAFEEGFEFPWDDYGDDYGNIEEWWKDVKGFAPVSVDPYDDKGNYVKGFNSRSPEVRAYHDERKAWEKANPLPVTLVNYCTHDDPSYILAAPDKSYTAKRGYPQAINLVEMQDNIEEDRAKLIQFLEEFEIEYDEDPDWLLSGYWG